MPVRRAQKRKRAPEVQQIPRMAETQIPPAPPLTPYVPPMPQVPRPVNTDPGVRVDRAWLQSQATHAPRVIERPEGVRGPKRQSRVEMEANLRRRQIYKQRAERGVECRQPIAGGGQTSRKVGE